LDEEWRATLRHRVPAFEEQPRRGAGRSPLTHPFALSYVASVLSQFHPIGLK
jgi:hypothetical protein